MNLEGWLESRVPESHPRLLERMREAISESEREPRADLPRAALDASLFLLRRVVAAGEAPRESALDLLAADALVTYACEAASDSPESLDDVSAEIIAALINEVAEGGPVRMGMTE